MRSCTCSFPSGFREGHEPCLGFRAVVAWFLNFRMYLHASWVTYQLCWRVRHTPIGFGLSVHGKTFPQLGCIFLCPSAFCISSLCDGDAFLQARFVDVAVQGNTLKKLDSKSLSLRWQRYRSACPARVHSPGCAQAVMLRSNM